MRALLSVDEIALTRIMKVCVIDLLRVGIGECSIKYVVRFVSGLSGLYCKTGFKYKCSKCTFKIL